ncbi:hypothetical protein ACEPAG_2073 [Sanghuangporus baumii]
MPYSEELRHSRQFLHQFFHQVATSQFHEIQVASTNKLLLAMFENPAKFAEHLHYSAGELILRIGYGYQANTKNDPYTELAERALHAATEAEGFFLVNALPMLKYLPEWFPGAHFMNTAKIGRELSRQMRSKIFAMAKKLIEDGKALTSMTSTLLEQNTNIDGRVSHEDLIARTVGTIYIAGTDTTSSVLVKFIQAMVLYPETMRQGQVELDNVIGLDTLPTMNDRPKLPYINAICKELLRYQPTAPLAIAHYTTEDDYYNGFYIPEGTIILPNVWAMLMDPKMYPEPNKFKPDRWLPPSGSEQPLQSNKMAFGFGRRICPGRHFAEDSIFIQVASILAVFDIQMAVDTNDDPIVPKEEYISAFIRKPMPFKCKITPRSDKSAKLIQQAVDSASSVCDTPKAD